MTGPDLFRREALDHWAPGAEGADAVEVSTPWLRWVSWLLAVTLVVGILVAFTAWRWATPGDGNG